MNFRPKTRRGPLVTLDITALIDVVFLLLIFLLVTTTFRRDEYAFIIDLPTSSVEEIQVSTDKTTIFVDKDGQAHLLMVPADAPAGAAKDISKAQKVSPEELKAALESLFQRRSDASIAIRGEKATSYQSMVEIVGVLQDIGFRSIYFPYELDAQ